MKNKIKFQINTIEEEKQIVEMTRKDVDFFKKHKIKITWPKNTTVEEEYDKEKYKKALKRIKNQWKEKNNNFLRKVSDFFDKDIGKVWVKISAYGPMGFYNAENNTVTININNDNPVETIKHEIIHILHDNLMKRGKPSHKSKERVVNDVLSTIENK